MSCRAVLHSNAGVILQSNGTDVPVENGTHELVCPFNNGSSPEMLGDPMVCLYSVRVTEVFIGQYSVSRKPTIEGYKLRIILFHSYRWMLSSQVLVRMF